MNDLTITRDISVSVAIFRLLGPIAESGAWDAIATAAVWNPSPDVDGLLSPVQQVLAGAHLESVSGRARTEARSSAIVLAISELCAELERLGLERTPCSSERSYLPGAAHPAQDIGLHPARRDLSVMVTAFRIDGGAALGLTEPAWQSVAVVAAWNPGVDWAEGPIQQRRAHLRTPVFHGRAKSSAREGSMVLAATMAVEQVEAVGLDPNQAPA